MLQHAEKEGQQSVVSWSQDGKKFTVHDPSGFVGGVFQVYFDAVTFTSFEQKLRRWGFVRTPANSTGGQATYSHPCFVRDHAPSLVWAKGHVKVGTKRLDHWRRCLHLSQMV